MHYSEEESVFKVRSFTPAKFEVTGAGHNLLGAVCLALLKKWDIFKNQGGAARVKIKDNEIPLKLTEENGLRYVGMRQSPAKIIGTVPTEIISEATGLRIEDFSLNGWATNIVETEIAHLMVPFTFVFRKTKVVVLHKPNDYFVRDNLYYFHLHRCMSL